MLLKELDLLFQVFGGVEMYNTQSTAVGPNGLIRYFWIPNFGDAYVIGDDGSLWSRYKCRGLGSHRGWEWYISDDWTRLSTKVSLNYSHCCYEDAHLRFNGTTYHLYIHKLVCEAVYGPCPVGLEVCHNDGDKSNNNYWNLRYDTRVNNYADKYRHGTDQRGERNHQAVLDWIKVREIRARHANGESQTSLALEHNVHIPCISRIVNNLRWIEE